MGKHSKMYECLENHYESIQRYKLSQDTEANTKATLFLIDLEEVNTNFHQFYKFLLLNEELLIVQSWINKLLGNYIIPRETREKIAIASIDFASMVECINNSHTSTI